MSEDLNTQLLGYPPSIQRVEKALLDLTLKMEDAHAIVKEMALTYSSNVENNPAFKNAGQRKAELESLLKADSAFQAAEAESRQLRQQVAITQIDMEYLKNMFKAYLAIVGGIKSV